MKTMKYVLMMFWAALGLLPVDATQPEELGKVNWLRDYEAGLAQSAASQKPVFLLFQEVPGCGTCKGYGNNVLSHPLVVEAIEEFFVPVAIFNNNGGADREVLQAYQEPSWNNPVVRIVDQEGKMVVPRIARDYSALGIVEAMGKALLSAGKEVPGYLELLWRELKAERKTLQTATLSMYCFWSGERAYGKMDGVIGTEAGFMHGREVVRVTYDPAQISYADLVKGGQAASCADRAYCSSEAQREVANEILGKGNAGEPAKFRSDHQNKYYLSRTNWRFVPMTSMQATKVNARLGSGQSIDDLLSPRQKALYAQVRKFPNRKWKNQIGQPFVAAWYSTIQS